MITDLGVVDKPLLLFGGPYSNLEATTAMLDEAQRLGFPPERIICTGDVVAYCADPQASVDAIRRSDIHVVMGNCEESLGFDNADCGCGFTEGSDCDALSRRWFAHAQTSLEPSAKAWMRRLSRQILLTINGRRLAVVHGRPSSINQFVFSSSPDSEKSADIHHLDVDGIIGGHSGLPFTQIIGHGMWHNPGAIGLPANDGISGGWYSTITPEKDTIRIAHHRLFYDHKTAAARIEESGLPEVYADCLRTGLWPNMDVLNDAERAMRARPLDPPIYLWPQPRRDAAE